MEGIVHSRTGRQARLVQICSFGRSAPVEFSSAEITSMTSMDEAVVEVPSVWAKPFEIFKKDCRVIPKAPLEHVLYTGHLQVAGQTTWPRGSWEPTTNKIILSTKPSFITT